MFTLLQSNHNYMVSVEGIKVHSKSFTSRAEADAMRYAIVGKYHLLQSNVYDDKHDKTYIFTNGVKIHINRVY